jgi:hypothetical protein
MQELQKRLVSLKEDFLKAYEKLLIDEKLETVAKLEKEVADPEIWKDIKKATEKNQELAKLNDEVQPWTLLKTQINDLPLIIIRKLKTILILNSENILHHEKQ